MTERPRNDRMSVSQTRRGTALVAVALTLVLALAPSLAEARAGSSTSSGSRGSRTYQDNGARPMERSVTPRQATPQPTSPSTAPRPAPAAPAPVQSPSFVQRHPFMSGLMGGFIGAGIAGMLFGSHAYAAEGSGAGSMLGLLLQFALIGGLVYLLYSIFRRRSPVMAQESVPPGASYYAGTAPAPVADTGTDIATKITDADYNAWSDLLTNIQAGWSKSDLVSLKRFATPEMLSYFSEQLSANASRGVENHIEQVRFLAGSLREAWSEGDMEYATASLTFSAVDYMVSTTPGTGGVPAVVSGDAHNPVEATEYWTFMRSRGGHWMLSAIQQV